MFDTKKHYLGITLAAACALTAHAVFAVEPAKVNTVIGEQQKVEEAAKASQQAVTKFDDEATRMLADYRQIIAETQSLKTYNDQLAVQVGSQSGELSALAQQLTEIDSTSREVLPMMSRMLESLDQFVKLDLPFLPEERSKRIASLKDLMARADVSISEKYRRIVEAYQIEMEYGRTIESYQSKVDDRTVEVLRAGRIGLMYQTLDGKETGYWNADSKSWTVANEYSTDIKAGLKIAKKQAAPDFLAVAVPAPKEAH